MNIIGAILLAVLIGVISIAADSFIAWLAIEWVAGHDINFAEAVGAGILLNTASGSGASVSRD